MKYIKTFENEEGYVMRKGTDTLSLLAKGIKFSDFGTRRRNSITIHEIDAELPFHELTVHPTDELTRLMHLGLITYNQEEKRFEFKKSDTKEICEELELMRTATKYNL